MFSLQKCAKHFIRIRLYFQNQMAGGTEGSTAATWAADGSSQTPFQDVCLITGRPIRGPLLLSRNNGAIVMAFSLSSHAIWKIAKEHAKCMEDQDMYANKIIKEPYSSNLCDVSKSLPLEQNIPIPPSVERPTAEEISRVGTILCTRYNSLLGKCYCEEVQRLHEATNREELFMRRCFSARKKLKSQ